jgi:ACS family 4-hydroxyphenylacetate permease-like MFS transporter
VTERAGAATSAIRKAFWRIAPWATLIYVFAYIDRVNVGFAALSMNKELGLTATTFGAANTILFALYTAFEVPSSMLLVRFGIRRWLPCIMIGWGVASACTMLAVDDYSLYGLRGLVGIAEAGLLPGLLYFLSRWFPVGERAKANSLFLASLPLALAIGGPVSGAIMGMDGTLGVSGWRWLFLLEGAPPILMGLAVILWLPSRPEEARWLSIEEKAALQGRLDQERVQIGKSGGNHAWKDVLNLPVILLALSYFCVVATVNTIGVWTPQIVKEMIGADASKTFLIGLLTAVPPIFAIMGMMMVSWSSDRTGKRVAHHIGVMGAAALGWAAIVLLPTPGLKLAGLALCALGGFSAFALFWTVSTPYIPHRSRAVGIAAIQTVGNLASITSPLVIGVLRDSTHNFYAGAWYTAALLSTGILVVLLITRSARGRARLVLAGE